MSNFVLIVLYFFLIPNILINIYEYIFWDNLHIGLFSKRAIY